MAQPRRRPAARLVRLGGVSMLGLVGVGTAGYLLVPLAARALVRAIEGLAEGSIWLATSISSGMSVWTMMATAWRTAASSLAAPAASAVLWGLVLVGLLALYWLQRILGAGQGERLGRQEGE